MQCKSTSTLLFLSKLEIKPALLFWKLQALCYITFYKVSRYWLTKWRTVCFTQSAWQSITTSRKSRLYDSHAFRSNVYANDAKSLFITALSAQQNHSAGDSCKFCLCGEGSRDASWTSRFPICFSFPSPSLCDCIPARMSRALPAFSSAQPIWLQFRKSFRHIRRAEP